MTRPSTRRLPAVLVGAAAVVVLMGGYALIAAVAPRPMAPPPAPSVLAGQQLWGTCAGGFYARAGDSVVVTSSGHCTTEGTVAYEPDGVTVRGVFGPPARANDCPHAGKTCAASDMNYLVVAPDRIPWGRLNQVNLGSGGYRVVEPGTAPLACADITIGDPVEINGRDIHRTGTVIEKGEYVQAGDADTFPCMIVADVDVAVGDSGGAVLVRGIPAGVTSRSFDGLIGFTPLAEGLEQLGLELCTTPDCDLDPLAARPGTLLP